MDTYEMVAVIRVKGDELIYEMEGGSPAALTRAEADVARFALAAARPGYDVCVVPITAARSLWAASGTSAEVRVASIRVPAQRAPVTRTPPTPLRQSPGARSLACEIVYQAVEDLDTLLDYGLVADGRPVINHPGWEWYSIQDYRSPRPAAELLLSFVDGTLDAWLDAADVAVGLDAVRERAGLPLRTTVEEELAELQWYLLDAPTRKRIPPEAWPEIFKAPRRDS